MLSRVHIPSRDSHAACVKRRSLPCRTIYWFGQERLNLSSPTSLCYKTLHRVEGIGWQRNRPAMKGFLGKTQYTATTLFSHWPICRLICFKTRKDHHTIVDQDKIFHKKSFLLYSSSIFYLSWWSFAHCPTWVEATRRLPKACSLSKKHIIMVSSDVIWQ